MIKPPKQSRESPAKNVSLASSLVSGSGWTIAVRWVSKFLGIISLAICARILSPSDYGLVNMAMVVVGFSQVLVEFGLDASLIRNQTASSEHYDTAWSLKIIQSFAITIIVIAAAPIASHIFKDPRVMPIMIAVAISSFLGGFQNIYIVDFRKNLNFRQDFVLAFVPRLASFFLSIVSVLILRTYWGLVIGICGGEIARMIMSYVMVRQRARWSLIHWKEMTGFSLWYFLDGLAQYSVYHLDRVYIGALGGAAEVGVYGVGREISALPGTELVLPIGRALMPTLAKLNDQPTRQIVAIEKALGGVMVIAVPVAIGFTLIAREFIILLFGISWTDAVPLVAILSFAAMTSGFRSTAQNILIVVGHIRVNAIISWIYAVVILGSLYPAYRLGGLAGVAWLYSVCGFLATAALGFYLHKLGLLAGWAIWLSLLRTFIAAGMMYLAVVEITPYFPQNLIMILIGKIVAGATAYSTVLLALWILMGRPDSSERFILNFVSRRR